MRTPPRTPKPLTLNPELKALNLNPKLKTLNPKLKTLNRVPGPADLNASTRIATQF